MWNILVARENVKRGNEKKKKVSLCRQFDVRTWEIIRAESWSIYHAVFNKIIRDFFFHCQKKNFFLVFSLNYEKIEIVEFFEWKKRKSAFLWLVHKKIGSKEIERKSWLAAAAAEIAQ